MDEGLVSRATAAAASLARDSGLPVQDVVVVQNANALGLRLRPADVFARVSVAGQEVAAFEVAVAQQLRTASAPVAALDPRVAPQVHARDGFAITFWTYYEPAGDAVPPQRYADALRSLHAAMRTLAIEAPPVAERIGEAETLVTDRDRTPALAAADRALLLDALSKGRDALHRAGDGQLLHGEPHAGNLLATREGPLFIDFETGCRGPVEFDAAHVPAEVAAGYPGLDRMLLEECRRLVLAMVAAWRWDVRDSFPDGPEHGRRMVAVLRGGPPWPTLAALSS